jgi:hypothetical protein
VIGNVNILAVGVDQMLSVWRPRSCVSHDISYPASRSGGQGHALVRVF